MPDPKEPSEVVPKEPEIVMEGGTGTNVAIPVRINAGVKFTLLKNHFVAALEKDGDVMMLLLAPTDSAGQEGNDHTGDGGRSQEIDGCQRRR